MFAGLVAGVGTIAEVVEAPTAKGDMRMTIVAPVAVPPEAGASMSCSGVCLTALAGARMEGEQARFEVEVSARTRETTTLGAWQKGGRVNVEPSLRVGDAIGGHWVAGHVDAVAEVVSVEAVGEGRASRRVRVAAPKVLATFLAVRGSVALDGVSLTPTRADTDGLLEVNLVPHTLAATTLGAWVRGSRVNLEVDVLARYVVRAMEVRA